MELPERKRQILKAIVESYIETAEPVGSKMIAGVFSQPISSATIRNEMSELEELGFLEKPHVSAGRVPSYAAYRLYVDELMESYRVTTGEIERLQAAMRSRLRELDNIMVNASRIVSHFTDHTSVSIVDRAGRRADQGKAPRLRQHFRASAVAGGSGEPPAPPRHGERGSDSEAPRRREGGDCQGGSV